jgi:hypothetical protein
MKITNNNLHHTENPETKLKNQLDQYEVLYFKKVLEASTKNVSLGGTGTGSTIMKNMYIDALSQEMAGKVGISQLLLENLKRR